MRNLFSNLQQHRPHTARAGNPSTKVWAIGLMAIGLFMAHPAKSLAGGKDTVPPVLIVAGPDTTYLEATTSPVKVSIPKVVSAYDSVDGNLIGSVSIDSSALQSTVLGIYTITYSVSDLSGNKAVVNRYVDVIDSLAPTITLKGLAVDSVEVYSMYVDSGATVSDGYYAASSIKVTKSGSFLTKFGTNIPSVIGVYTIVYTAIDPNGNKASVTRIVKVQDRIAPVVFLNGNWLIQVCQGSTYVDSGYTATDNYDPSLSVKDSGSFEANGFSTATPGLYTLYYVTYDESGNRGISGPRFIEVLPSNDNNCKTGGSQNTINNSVCKSSCITLTSPVSGAAYKWSTGDSTKSIQVCPADEEAASVTVTVSGGTVSYLYGILLTSNTCVWPGDANADGVADKNDVLAIGVAYGDSGSVRANASTNWTGQPSADWASSFKSGANHKNADCNGDGKVDSTDMAAIAKNYGQTHSKASLSGSPSDPPLSVAFSNDSAMAGDTVTATLTLGTAANPVSDAYGVAFSIGYSSLYVKPGKAMANLSNCWLGMPGKSLIYFVKDDSANSTVDIAITRTDHKNMSGYGELAKLNIVMQDNLGGKRTVSRKVVLTPTAVNAISFDETQIPLYATGDSVIVTGPLAGIGNTVTQGRSIRVYPNPATQSFFVDPGSFEVSSIRLTNELGMVVYEQTNPSKGIIEIPVAQLKPGIYTVLLNSRNGAVVRQVLKQ